MRWVIKKTVVLGAFLLLGGSLLLIPLVGVELMPSADEGEVRVNAEMAVGTKVAAVNDIFKKIEAIIAREVPEIKNTVSFIGRSGWRARGSNSGEVRIALKPKTERTRSSEEIASTLRRKLKNIPGVKIRTRAGQGLFILRMGASGADKVQIDIRGHDLDVADELAKRISQAVDGVDGVTDTQISRDTGTPEEMIIVDRQKAADMKLTVSRIANTLKTVLSGTVAGNYRESGKEYQILVKLQDAEQHSLRDILDLPVTNLDGDAVILRNVVRVEPRLGPLLIERKDQERVVVVTGNITERDLGSILDDIRERLRAIPVPHDFSIIFAGDYEEQQKRGLS